MAGGLGATRNREIDFSGDIKTELDNLGIGEWTVVDIEGSDGVTRYLKVEECITINEEVEEISQFDRDGEPVWIIIPTSSQHCTTLMQDSQYFKGGDLAEMDTWEEERMEQIAQTSLDRKDRTYNEIRRGETTIR